MTRPDSLELARRKSIASDDGGNSAADYYRRQELDAPPEAALEFLRDELGLNHGMALSGYGAIRENVHLFQSSRKNGVPLPDDAWRQINNILLDIIAEILKSQNPKLTAFAGLHAHDTELFDMMNGFKNMEAFAATVTVPKENLVLDRASGKSVLTLTYEPLTKAAVNNAVLDLQKKWGLPPRKDQRSEETRATQSAKRKSQLKTP